VIGANDVTNPAAEEDKSSPIYGMPVLQVWKAGTVMFIKCSLASGYAGIDNPLFYRDSTMMLLGEREKVTENIVKAMYRGQRDATSQYLTPTRRWYGPFPPAQTAHASNQVRCRRASFCPSGCYEPRTTFPAPAGMRGGLLVSCAA
jgi:hypothetical protein